MNIHFSISKYERTDFFFISSVYRPMPPSRHGNIKIVTTLCGYSPYWDSLTLYSALAL